MLKTRHGHRKPGRDSSFKTEEKYKLRKLGIPTDSEPESSDHEDAASDQSAHHHHHHHDDDDDDLVDPSDREFFTENARAASFLSHIKQSNLVLVSQQKQATKHARRAEREKLPLPGELDQDDKSGEDMEKDGEKDALRTWGTPPAKRMRMTGRLPVIEKGKVIHDMEEEVSEDEPQEEQEPAADGYHSDSSSASSVLSQGDGVPANPEAQDILKAGSSVASLCNKVMSSPETELHQMKAALTYLDHPTPAVRKLSVLSIAAVYMDILPSYRIRPITEKEKAQRTKQETRMLRDYEEKLVSSYQNYLKKMYECGLKEEKDNDPHGIMLATLKAMGQLLLSRPNFNFRTNLITTLVTFACRRTLRREERPESVRLVCDTLGRLFEEDERGDATMETIKMISRITKLNHYKVHPAVLRTFLCLQIRREFVNPDPVDKGIQGKELADLKARMSKKELRQFKKEQKLKQEIKSAQQEVAEGSKKHWHTNALSIMFNLFFRVMKEHPRSPLMTPVLEGLSNFSHCLSVEYFPDILRVLEDLIAANKLPIRGQLAAISTVMAIRQGEGEALQVDLHRFWCAAYSILIRWRTTFRFFREGLDLPAPDWEPEEADEAEKDFDAMIALLKQAFGKFAMEEMLGERVAAFARRLALLAVEIHPGPAGKILDVLRMLAQRHPQVRDMLDGGQKVPGVYRPDVPDPDLTGARSETLWELGVLKRSFDLDQRQEAVGFFKGVYGDVMRAL